MAPDPKRVVRASADDPRIPALLSGRLADPFGFLGPHDTAEGRIVRTFQPGADAVDVIARADDTLIGRLTPVERRRPLRRRREYRSALPVAHPLAGNGSGDRRPLQLRSRAWRSRPASVFGRRALEPGRAARRGRRPRSRASAACASPCGRPTPDASPWSATSTCGTDGAIPCGCAMMRACGNCSCRVSAPEKRYKYEIVGRIRRHLAAKGRPLGARDRAPAGDRIRRAAAVSYALERRRLDAQRARAAMRRRLRSPSMKSTPGPGSGPTGDPAGMLDWKALAEKLIPYVCDLGFTHIELLPIMEHPFRRLLGLSAAVAIRAQRALRRAA